MKRLSIAVLFVALFATMAFAAVQDFGRFTVDVADGWTGSQNGPSAIIVKNDNTASLSITIDKTQGYALKDLASAFVEEFKKSYPTVSAPEATDDGDFTFTAVNANGVESSVLLTGDEEEYCMFVMTGVEAAGAEMSAMLGSIKEK